jgi:hypothetical protein
VFAIAFALTLAGPARAQFLLRGSVLGNGGSNSSNGTFSLVGTVGQPAVGLSTGASFVLSSGFWAFGGSRVVAVDPSSGPRLPDHLAFDPPAPNPSRESVRLVVALPKPAALELAIFDVTGRRLRELASGEWGAGEHLWRWDGSDRDGRRVPGGIYFARLLVDGRVFAERRMVVLH